MHSLASSLCAVAKNAGEVSRGTAWLAPRSGGNPLDAKLHLHSAGDVVGSSCAISLPSCATWSPRGQQQRRRRPREGHSPM